MNMNRLFLFNIIPNFFYHPNLRLTLGPKVFFMAMFLDCITRPRDVVA